MNAAMRYPLLLVLVIAAIAGGAYVWADRHPAVAEIDPPNAETFDADQVASGRTLVAIGNCVVCHTSVGGEPLAGGRELPTPFGAVYSTNITPDPGTGIGRWSEAAFVRAMRQGIDRNGTYLYPAFPYTHFTRATDRDLEAIYAYLMVQRPVESRAPPSDLVFPLNHRILLAGWNLLFHADAPFTPDTSRDAEWNRGAYLVEGLGHCGMCHTPRNLLGAEITSLRFAGGEAEGWHAPPLNQASPAQVPWTADALVNYLLDGWDSDHGIAAGPMTAIVDQLAVIPEDDAYAIAAYLVSFQDQTDLIERRDAANSFALDRQFGARPSAADDRFSPTADSAFGRGGALFLRVCANCHRAGGQPVPLALTSTVNASDPRNLIHIIDEGIRPPDGSYERSMPAFGGSIGDDQLSDLVTFVRRHFSGEPAWPEIPAAVRAVRQSAELETSQAPLPTSADQAPRE